MTELAKHGSVVLVGRDRLKLDAVQKRIVNERIAWRSLASRRLLGPRTLFSL